MLFSAYTTQFQRSANLEHSCARRKTSVSMQPVPPMITRLFNSHTKHMETKKVSSFSGHLRLHGDTFPREHIEYALEQE